MQPDETKEKKKQTYEKPRLRTIELAAEEVLGVGCKLASSGFAFDQTPCTPGPCSAEGS